MEAESINEEAPVVRLKEKSIDAAVIGMVPARFAAHYKVIPVELVDGILTVAMADPLDVRTLDDLRLLLGVEARGVRVDEREIFEAIRHYYGVGAATLDALISRDAPDNQVSSDQERTLDLEAKDDDEASIITFVNQILSQAVRERATDIHLEPFPGRLRSRFRIDGVLYETSVPESMHYFYPRIVSRVKIMASLNIVERRLPQDGRIRIKVDGRELDLRVATMPVAFGEGVHIRILTSRLFLELEKLGFLPENLAIIEQALRKQHGIIFVTGPTGSGKSTTLYAALARLNHPTRKIITIEDPIEYQMYGVNQMQINPAVGLSFAASLRNVLRHDPDILMVGEVRDRETADIAIRSALTGHLVFSSLHTNDAAGTVTRLLDMGIEPFLVASSLECLIAQRLVRLICPECKEPVEGSENPGGQVFYEGKGCPACRFTGYRGRTGIHEIVPMSEAIRTMILKNASSQEIKEKAVAEGMVTLREDGFKKAAMGLTTTTEVFRVTQQDDT